MGTHDPTRRFSGRVANYLNYRPRYPARIIDWLIDQAILRPADHVADVGSGTGFLAEIFLQRGFSVVCIEPNPDMRQAGEAHLAPFASTFRSLDATAEQTTLPPDSVDVITAGQAFHWFDQAQARQEFLRILKPGGWVVLVWNERRDASTPFLADYEQMLQRHATDYGQVDHRRISDQLLSGWFAGPMKTARFDNTQQFDLAGVRGRLLSSSYVPGEGEEGFAPMIRELEAIFVRHAHDGLVAFDYDTRVYAGTLAHPH